jgi:hypothetical protein
MRGGRTPERGPPARMRSERAPERTEGAPFRRERGRQRDILARERRDLGGELPVPDGEAPKRGPEPLDLTPFDKGPVPERSAPAPMRSERAPERTEDDRFRPELGSELHFLAPERSDLDGELPVPDRDAQARSPDPRDPPALANEDAREPRAPAPMRSDPVRERKEREPFRPELARKLHGLATERREVHGKRHEPDSDAPARRAAPRHRARFKKELALEPTRLTTERTNKAQRSRAGTLPSSPTKPRGAPPARDGT